MAGYQGDLAQVIDKENAELKEILEEKQVHKSLLQQWQCIDTGWELRHLSALAEQWQDLLQNVKHPLGYGEIEQLWNVDDPVSNSSKALHPIRGSKLV